MDGNVDPESILLAIESLLGNITDVESTLLNQRGDSVSHTADVQVEEEEALHAHTHVIARLQAVTQELRQVTLVCVKYAEYGNSIESPLDPMLYDWISDCALILLGIKELVPTVDANRSHDPTGRGDELDEEWTPASPVCALRDVDALCDSLPSPVMREQGNKDSAKRDEEGKGKETLENLLEKLKDHTMHLEDFIPIMRADLNESLATNVSQTQLSHDPPRATRHEGNFSAPSSHHARNSLESLRACLYNLSDEMKTSQELLGALSSIRALLEETQTELFLLKEAQATTITTLAELLSNNGSEWIESMLAGKLSFSEFSALDQGEIEDFSAGLRTRNTELRSFVRIGGRGVGEAVDGVDLGATEVRWWRERAEGLNWTLKTRTQV